MDEAGGLESARFYEALSAEYDLFVDWEARLAYEMPLLERRLRAHGARRVLDVACGTGQHAIALARAGFDVVGVDASEAMVARARENAAQAGVNVRFATLGFGELAPGLGETFDALLCLGSSLPHLLSEEALARSLRDFARVLTPGGLLLTQQRNFDGVLARRERYMPPQAARRGDQEWLFVRFYDFVPPLVRFNMLRMYRAGGGQWQWRSEEAPLHPWRAAELRAAAEPAGFALEEMLGALSGEPFDAENSSDVVLVAHSVVRH